MARPKKAGVELRSIEECERALRELLEAQIRLDQAIGARDLEVAKASAGFEASIDGARDEAAKLTAALKDYYYAHRAEIEKDGRKHLQLANGVMGRRDNPPALKPRTKHITWASVKIAVKQIFGMEYFLPAKDRELDKDALKRLTEEQLARVNLVCASEETFYVEPARLPAEGAA